MKNISIKILLGYFILMIMGMIVFLTNAEAKEKDNNAVSNKVRMQSQEENEEDEEEENEEDEEEENWQKTKIEDDEFETSGIISGLGENFFTVNQITIYIDLTKVEEFKQKGILEDGERVKVEGIIIDNIYYAEEINVIGTGQGRYKVEIKGASVIPSPTPSATVIPSPTPSASIVPSPVSTPIFSSLPEASPTPITELTLLSLSATGLTEDFEEDRTLLQDLGLMIKTKLSHSIENMEDFIKQISEYFKN